MAFPLLVPKVRKPAPTAQKQPPVEKSKKTTATSPRHSVRFYRSSRRAAEPTFYSWIQPGGFGF